MDGALDMTEREGGVEDAQERLSREDIAAEGLLASTHLHRYELASELVHGLRVLDLCCGTGYGSQILARRAVAVTGVDNDAETIAAAQRQLEQNAGGERIDFSHADAIEYLERVSGDAYDAVVCFEGIEHVPDPVAVVDGMARLARRGARVIVSLPNSRGFNEENPFHVTDFGYEEAMDLLTRLGEPVVLSQFLAEGSLLTEAEPDREVVGRLVGDAQPTPEWANNWVAVVNVPSDELRRAVARLRIATSAHHNEYMRDLERANRELERANGRLARAWLGVHDAAAASVMHRYESRAQEAEARVEYLEQRLELEIEIAKQNDRYFQEARVALAAPRYRAVDKLRDLVLVVPSGRRLVRAMSRRLSRSSGR
jgi:2-polyprenyl-3-methyl-5-hydroxy-6-metoxy-1,4-benzoquinol methylase